MGNKIKRFLSLVMAIAMVISLMPHVSIGAKAATPDTLYLKPGVWTADSAWFAAYFFGNGEKWVKMTDSNGDGVYEVAVPSGYPNVIFCRMKSGTTAMDWSNKWNQTADLTIGSDNCYSIADWGSGSWGTYMYYVAGTNNGWDAAGTKMTRNGDGTYSVTISGVSGEFKFKVTDGTWNNAWGDGQDTDGNTVVNLATKSSVTITFDPVTKAITHTVSCEEHNWNNKEGQCSCGESHEHGNWSYYNGPEQQCGICGYVCEHVDHDTDGVCPVCGYPVSHIYSNTTGKCEYCGVEHICAEWYDDEGVCLVCGAEKPSEPTSKTYTFYYDNSDTLWDEVNVELSCLSGVCEGVEAQMAQEQGNVYAYTFAAECDYGFHVYFTGGEGAGKVFSGELEDGKTYKHTHYDEADDGYCDSCHEWAPGNVPNDENYVIYFDNSASQWDEVWAIVYGGTTGDDWREEVQLTAGEGNIYTLNYSAPSKRMAYIHFGDAQGKNMTEGKYLIDGTTYVGSKSEEPDPDQPGGGIDPSECEHRQHDQAGNCYDCGTYVGHTAGEWYTTQDASCMNEGRKQQDCLGCGVMIDEEIIPREDHTPAEQWITSVGATCTTDGEEELHCSVCSALLNTRVVPSEGHTPGDLHEDPADCNDNGVKQQFCNTCGTELLYEVIPSTGHSFSDWYVVNEATCVQNGYRERACSACGEKEQEAILAGHKYNENDVCTGCGEPKPDGILNTQFELIEALKAGGNVTLQGDIQLSADCYATVPSGVTATLDLNGFTLSGTEQVADGYTWMAGIINNEGTLTVKDSKGTGKMTANLGNLGTMTVENGTYHNLNVNFGNTVINGGTFGTLLLQQMFTLYPDGTEVLNMPILTLTVNNATVSSFYVFMGGNVAIKGGNFTDLFYVEENEHVTVSITGGKFAASDASKYVADGYVWNADGSVTKAGDVPVVTVPEAPYYTWNQQTSTIETNVKNGSEMMFAFYEGDLEISSFANAWSSMGEVIETDGTYTCSVTLTTTHFEAAWATMDKDYPGYAKPTFPESYTVSYTWNGTAWVRDNLLKIQIVKAEAEAPAAPYYDWGTNGEDTNVDTWALAQFSCENGTNRYAEREILSGSYVTIGEVTESAEGYTCIVSVDMDGLWNDVVVNYFIHNDCNGTNHEPKEAFAASYDIEFKWNAEKNAWEMANDCYNFVIACETEPEIYEVRTLADLFEALAHSEKPIVVAETIVVPAGQNAVLNLNGKTVSMVYTKDAGKNHEMILVKGNLTIQGEGKLSYEYTGASLGTTYAANTVTVDAGGSLVVKSGIIENLTYDSAVIAYAIDGRTNGGTANTFVTIEGGSISSLRQAVRMFANAQNGTASLKISGGDITGRVILQNANKEANKAALEITGGTFNANAYKTEVLYVGGSTGANMALEANVSGGTFNGGVLSSVADEKFITGGTFTADVSEFVADGYELKDGTVSKLPDTPSVPEVVIPEVKPEEVEVDEETYSVVIDDLNSNAAAKDFELSEGVKSMTIELVNVQQNTNTGALTISYDVNPVWEEGAVSVTFRLPVTGMCEKVNVYHEGELIMEKAVVLEDSILGGRYVEVTSSDFSVYAIEEIVTVYAAAINGEKFETLADALEAAKTMTGDVTVEIYDKVTLNQSLIGSFDSIKFVGKDTDAEIYLDVQGYITATGKDVAFEDLTLSKAEGGFISNAGFMNVAFGIFDVKSVAYTNCVFANGACASFGEVTFTGCTFYRSWDKYGLWAYGDVEVTVDGCTFADYRGIKMYAEGKAKTVDLTVKDTDFSAVDNKPAIVLTSGESVTLEGNTYSSTGVFELDLDGVPNGTPVTSDVPVTAKNDNGACGVMVDGKIYTTVADASAVATSGSTVTLLHESTETVELAEGVILEKNGFTADGITVAQPAAPTTVEVDSLAELQAALADTSNDLPIVITATIVIPEGEPVTIDLNGKTVTVPEAAEKHIYALDNRGELTLKDSVGGGSITSRGIYNGYKGNAENAMLTVEGGKYVGMDSDGGAAIFNGAELIINGGEYFGVVCAVNNNLNTANTTINGGTFGGAYDGGKSTNYVIQNNKGTLTINDADVVSGFGAVGCFGGTIVINDGDFQPTGWEGYTSHVVYVAAAADVTINGGNFKMNYPADKVPDSGSAVANYYKGTLSITGGIFTAHFDNVSPVELSAGSEITGGTFLTHSGEASTHSYVTNYVKEGYELKDGTVVAATTTYEVATFAELKAAIAAAQDGDVIVMTADITSSEQLMIHKAITLDLGGKTLTTTNGWGGLNLKNGPSVKNGTLNHTGNVAAIKAFNVAAIEDLTIDVAYTAGKTKGGIVIQENSVGVGSIKNVTIKGDGLTNGIETYNCGNATQPVIGAMENVTIDATGTGMLISAPCGTATNCNINGDVNGIEIWIKGTYSASLDLVNSTVTGGVYAHDEINSNPGVVNNGTLSLTTDAATTGASAEDVALTIARAENVEGVLEEVMDNAVAKVGDTYYLTLAAAIAAAQDGDTVTLLTDVELAETIIIEKAIAIEGNGKKITGNDDLIQIKADLTLNNVVMESGKYDYVMAIKANDCNIELNGCTVTGPMKGYGTSSYIIKSGTYMKGNSAFSSMLNGAQVYGGTFHYEVQAKYCAPGYAPVDNGDGTWTVKYDAICFIDADNDGIMDEGEKAFGSLEALFAENLSGEVTVVLLKDAAIEKRVDTAADTTYNFVTNVDGGVKMDFQYAEDWNYIQKASIGEKITVNAPYLLVWTALDVYGNVNTDYFYLNGGETTIHEGAVVNANTGDATTQVKNGTVLTVNGTLNTATLNVWAGASKLIVSGQNAEVNATWIDIWDGTPSVTVANGATLDTDAIKASRGGSIAVNDATLTSDKIELGHNGNSKGEMTVTGNSTVSEIVLTTADSTVAGAENMNVTTNLDGYVVVYVNGIHKVVEVPDLPTATVTETYVDELTFSMNFKADEATDEQLAYYGDWYADFELTVNKDITLNANGGADGWLSGQYDAWSSNWVNVPFEDVTLKAGETLKIMEYASELMGKPGLKYTYGEVYEFVKDFDCGMFLSEEFIKNNPDVEITLELKAYNNAEGSTESYTIGETYIFTLPKLPTATVTETYVDELTFSMNFLADEVSKRQLAFYGDWYADFELTVNKDITLNANGDADGYLSGQYDAWSENWVNVPFEDVTLKANETLKIMEYAAELMGKPGLKYTYKEVYEAVKDFDCGMFLSEEFIKNNPDVVITLELRMYNNENEEESYTIGDTYIFTLTPALPTATVTETDVEDLTFSMNFKADEVTDRQLAYYGDWYADFELTVNKDITLNANGDADGYLSGQYDAWSENWVNVPFEDVTLKANETLKIMAYAAELMGKPGLKYTYKEVYEAVKDFDCGMFLSEEFIKNNPDVVITLELRMYNNKNEEESYTIGDTYIFKLEDTRFKFYGTNLNLGNDLDLKFAFLDSHVEDWTGYYVEMVRTYGDGTANHVVRVESADWIKQGKFNIVVYEGFAAKEMCDDITVTVYDPNGNAVSESKTDSIRAYAKRAFDDEPAVRTVAVDLLNYGAAAQVRFGYCNENELANDVLSAEDQQYATSELRTIIPVEGEVDANKVAGANLNVQSNITFQIAFRNITEGMYATVEYTDHYGNVVQENHNFEKMEVNVNENDTVFHVVNIKSMVVSDARCKVTVTMYNADDTVYAVYEDSIASYALRGMNNTNWGVFEAFMKFADSAHAYLHRNDNK